MDKPVSSSDLPISLPKRLVLGCGALVHEMVAILDQNPRIHAATKLHCLPAKLHNTPQFIAPRVDEYLAEHAAEYDEVFIGYADCGTGGDLDRVLDKYDNATRLSGAHCYEFYAGSAVFEQLAEEELGSFYLTDYLVKNFQRLIIEGLGLDRYPELFDVYFEHYKRLVYLAQTENQELQAMAEQFAEQLGWEYVYRFVGIKGLEPLSEPMNAASKFKVEVHNGTN